MCLIGRSFGLAGHAPSCVGFFTLNSAAPLLETAPLANLTLYESPRFKVSNAQPSVPRLGGSTTTDPSFPAIVALIWKTPFFSLICAPLTGPFSPFASLYLKPFTASPLQKGLDVIGLVPVGRVYV